MFSDISRQKLAYHVDYSFALVQRITLLHWAQIVCSMFILHANTIAMMICILRYAL